MVTGSHYDMSIPIQWLFWLNFRVLGTFLVAMAMVVKVTRVCIFFNPFGPKGHLLAKFCENRDVSNVRRVWSTFALYYINYASNWKKWHFPSHFKWLYLSEGVIEAQIRHLKIPANFFANSFSAAAFLSSSVDPPTQDQESNDNGLTALVARQVMGNYPKLIKYRFLHSNKQMIVLLIYWQFFCNIHVV